MWLDLEVYAIRLFQTFPNHGLAEESIEYSLHLGATPLFLASLAGHIGVVQILLQAQAQVDSWLQL